MVVTRKNTIKVELIGIVSLVIAVFGRILHTQYFESSDYIPFEDFNAILPDPDIPWLFLVFVLLEIVALLCFIWVLKKRNK